MDRLASGLGMAICQRIVMLHSGRIWVESAEAHGTVVHFTLSDMAFSQSHIPVRIFLLQSE